MREREAARVQELPLEPELVGTAVHRVPGDGEVDRSEMHADLVRPPRLEPDGEQRVAREELADLEVRHRHARVVGVERLSQRVAAVAPEGRVDPAAAGPRATDDERGVMTLEGVFPHELLQPPVGLFGARDDHQPGRVAIETMDDAGTIGVAARDVVLEQGVDERAARVPRRRMHNQACRLVDNDQVLVLVGDP